MGLFGALFGSKRETAKSLPDLVIPSGPVEIEASGTAYCKVSMTDSDDCMLSLTNRNDYQIEMGWPEPGIVNINSDWSSQTDDKNWIGYIPARFAAKLVDVVASHNVVRVHARVSVGSKPSVKLMLPEEYT